ncbi:MAG: beta-glucosidase [Pyrinomonadaceae bacterium]
MFRKVFILLFMFQSYLMGGFECSTHRNFQNRRIDVIEATHHDRFAEQDYERLLNTGMQTARDGVRWHLIEKSPYIYDFSSLENQAAAAKKTGIQIIWDFFHYGYPDDLDIFSPEFIDRFTKFSVACAEFLKRETNRTLFICPTNEVSFFAWIAGEVGGFFPFAKQRGDEMKRQLVRATIASIDAIRELFPDTRFVQTDPAIRITPSDKNPKTAREAADYHASQFQALDMLTGNSGQVLGGDNSYLDIIGINYYFNNQWRHPSGRRVYRHHKNYQPFHELIETFYRRYQKPVLIAETGIENKARPEWFRYIFEQAKIAESRGVPVPGICLYPINNHPGWDDNRHCRNGLWDYANERGERDIYQPLADEIRLCV